MLYQLYESQRALMAPFAEFASAVVQALQPSAVAVRPYADGAARRRQLRPDAPAGQGVREAALRHHQRPTVDGVEVAMQEQVALEKPFCRLLRFKRFTDDRRCWRR